MKLFALIACAVATGYAQDLSNCNSGVQKQCSKDGKQATACKDDQKCSSKMSDHKDDSDFVTRMVAAHNKYRSQPYTGQGKRIFGADMTEVTWDPELELNAYIWALDLCQRTGGTDDMVMEHDDCRSTPSFSYVGQNIAWKAGGSWTAPIDPDEKAVRGWNAENATVKDSSYITESVQDIATIGHFTQLMWAKSFKIGCAYVTSKSPEYKVQGWVVCNYGPGGNFNSGPVLTEGNLGSQCINGSRAETSDSLCKVTDTKSFRAAVDAVDSS